MQTANKKNQTIDLKHNLGLEIRMFVLLMSNQLTMILESHQLNNYVIVDNTFSIYSIVLGKISAWIYFNKIGKFFILKLMNMYYIDQYYTDTNDVLLIKTKSCYLTFQSFLLTLNNEITRCQSYKHKSCNQLKHIQMHFCKFLLGLL